MRHETECIGLTKLSSYLVINVTDPTPGVNICPERSTPLPNTDFQNHKLVFLGRGYLPLLGIICPVRKPFNSTETIA